MKIALIGYGKMGREVEQAARQRGHAIAARIDPLSKDGSALEVSAQSIGSADVCIEFTQPEAAVRNVEQTARLHKPLVVGTTGWYEHLPAVEKMVVQEKTGLVYAPNFSLGVNLFYRIAETAARLFHRFEEYDVCGMETHHRRKVDSPSGTARKLSEIVLQHFPRKQRVVGDSLNRAIEPEEFHLVSLRAGHFPGTHSLVFDSAADTVELAHTARSRAGFASGALLAAEWIVGRQGIYTFEQVLEDLLGGEAP
ncbi:MAG: 4-hydroxy-tetrahydrodipicolinate reductase [Acidobacteria bacterium]|nr:4-hydroxy-tetrahydrodipicolinate reductase [Acidobacteriota bacterium]MCI0620359.1 4-hydroxy-tetrahydrodipicolinate reductase [Acidobacteriota bacterium]MCI0720143.1 4-hydroxy-tetrahydrodipicolinate reductase [Acidobacteriota bacterium]